MQRIKYFDDWAILDENTRYFQKYKIITNSM